MLNKFLTFERFRECNNVINDENGAPTLISDPTIISIFGEFTPLRILTFQNFSPPYGNFRPYAYYIFGKFTPLR